MPSGLYHVRKRPDLAHAHSSVKAFPQLDTWITYDKQYVAKEHIQGVNLKTNSGLRPCAQKTAADFPIHIFDGPTLRKFSFVSL